MITLVSWPRLIAAGLLAVPLALVSGAHALSSASLRGAPDLALAAFPANGLAQENLAYGKVTADEAAGPLGLERRAAAAAKAARAAIAREPLSPRAYAILALAAADNDRKIAMVARASRLTRRDLLVQALVLEHKGAASDYIGVLGTIDEILRVHPERQAEFFPILANALEVPAAVPGYARLLARPLPWREAFLTFAVAQDGALDNLAAVREQIALSDRAFDKRLIARLAETGRLATAERLFRRLGATGGAAAGTAVLDWNSDYPPFEWRLADAPGLRAQTANRPDLLEIDVAPGNGGVIASRLVRNPGHPFVISMSHAIEPAAQIKDVKLVITCPGQSTPVFERGFAAGDNAFDVDQTVPCDYLELAITARSWTDARALSGTVSPLRIASKKQ